MYECRCNGRLQTKRFTRLAHTGLVVELEDLKIKTRLTNKKFVTRALMRVSTVSGVRCCIFQSLHQCNENLRKSFYDSCTKFGKSGSSYFNDRTLVLSARGILES